MSISSDLANYLRWVEEGWHQGREAEIVDEIFARDYVGHLPGQEFGFGDLVSHLANLRKAFPDAHLVVEDTIEADPKAVIRWTFSGTQNGEYMGTPASGRRFQVGGLSLLRFESGMLAEEWIHWDVLGHFTQLGISLPGA